METAQFLSEKSEIFRSLEGHNYELFASELGEASDAQVYFWRNSNENNMGRLATIVVPNKPGTIISLGRCDKNQGEDSSKVLGSAGNIQRVFLDQKFWVLLNVKGELLIPRISRRHVELHSPKDKPGMFRVKRPSGSSGRVVVNEEYPGFWVHADLKKDGSYPARFSRKPSLALVSTLLYNGIQTQTFPVGIIVPELKEQSLMLSFIPATNAGFNASITLFPERIDPDDAVWNYWNMHLEDFNI